MTFKSLLYAVLRISNDVRAVQNGKVGKRIGRRAYGKVTGRLVGRLFR